MQFDVESLKFLSLGADKEEKQIDTLWKLAFHVCLIFSINVESLEILYSFAPNKSICAFSTVCFCAWFCN